MRASSDTPRRAPGGAHREAVRIDAPTQGEASGPSTGAAARRRLTARVFFGAAVGLAVSVPLPWASAIGLIDVHLRPVGVVMMLLFAAAYVGAGVRVGQQRLSRAIVVGLWVVNVIGAVVVVGVFSRLLERLRRDRRVARRRRGARGHRHRRGDRGDDHAAAHAQARLSGRHALGGAACAQYANSSTR